MARTRRSYGPGRPRDDTRKRNRYDINIDALDGGLPKNAYPYMGNTPNIRSNMYSQNVGTYDSYIIGGYTRDQFISLLDAPIPNADALRRLSQYAYIHSPNYRSIINTMGGLKRWDTAVDPAIEIGACWKAPKAVEQQR